MLNNILLTPFDKEMRHKDTSSRDGQTTEW